MKIVGLIEEKTVRSGKVAIVMDLTEAERLTKLMDKLVTLDLSHSVSDEDELPMNDFVALVTFRNALGSACGR